MKKAMEKKGKKRREHKILGRCPKVVLRQGWWACLRGFVVRKKKKRLLLGFVVFVR